LSDCLDHGILLVLRWLNFKKEEIRLSSYFVKRLTSFSPFNSLFPGHEGTSAGASRMPDFPLKKGLKSGVNKGKKAGNFPLLKFPV